MIMQISVVMMDSQQWAEGGGEGRGEFEIVPHTFNKATQKQTRAKRVQRIFKPSEVSHPFPLKVALKTTQRRQKTKTQNSVHDYREKNNLCPNKKGKSVRGRERRTRQ
jgi:hypothetical protein